MLEEEGKETRMTKTLRRKESWNMGAGKGKIEQRKYIGKRKESKQKGMKC